MASSLSLPPLQGPFLHRSYFLGQTFPTDKSSRLRYPTTTISKNQKPTAKFNLFELLGGRGLCNGEEGIQQELKRDIAPPPPPPPAQQSFSDEQKPATTIEGIPESGFEKELLGLTGGFPGGETGLQKFIEQNPPPQKPSSVINNQTESVPSSIKKPKAPELPPLLPSQESK